MIAVRVIAKGAYRVVAMKKGASCPAEDFLATGSEDTAASREGLLDLIDRVSEEGLAALPPALCHLADQKRGIYEFRKGRLRLFFFKGLNGDVAVCTGGVLKKSQRADKLAVDRAASMKQIYMNNADNITYEDE
ncbi:type II toxin-antitoxin system RelE/ParE family toxin [Hydrogenophaga sp. PAMC20947]|uniref:type II toxin-antitoxin system RelE/ParE family toxin n=1 Tax=Hydrogenophaga sp. PAMC20947 TaxID=2565558 RepID=UPI00109DFC3D|nr:type II toxin-antitoxin system RelE/ParE family toxin [Hydrogenophaga sp. PAMC20947]QCB46622.1 hypothetical protein E5678_11660 [Hydrogenophaga sp. PAMC20947]